MGVGVGVGAGPGTRIAVGVGVGDGVGVGKVGVGLWNGSAGGVGTLSGEISSPDRIATSAMTNITTHMLTHRKTRERVGGFLRALEDDVVDKSGSIPLFYAVIHPRPSGAHRGSRRILDHRSPPPGAFSGGATLFESEREPPLQKTSSAAYTLGRDLFAEDVAVGCPP